MLTTNASVHDPDGVPHQVIGLTWVFALAAALGAFAALTIGGAVSITALLLIPVVIFWLSRRADRQRDSRRALVSYDA
jgi:Flp pilus assembly protein TadB